MHGPERTGTEKGKIEKARKGKDRKTSENVTEATARPGREHLVKEPES